MILYVCYNSLVNTEQDAKTTTKPPTTIIEKKNLSTEREFKPESLDNVLITKNPVKIVSNNAHTETTTYSYTTMSEKNYEETSSLGTTESAFTTENDFDVYSTSEPGGLLLLW